MVSCNTLTRRTMLRTASLAATAAAFPLRAWENSQMAVTVNPEQKLGRLPAMGLGFSMEKNLIGRQDTFVSANNDFIGCCNRLGPQVFRIGGNNVNLTRWDARGKGGVDHVTSPRDLEIFASFVRSLGWKVIYSLNQISGTPKTTAEEGKLAAELLGDALLGYEIGNEPNLYAFHNFRPKEYAYEAFMQDWYPHARALQAAVPHARLTGPGPFNEGWKRYASPMAKELKNALFMLTSHYYRANGKKPDANLDMLFDDLPSLKEEMKTLVAVARENRIAAGFRMVETNSFFGGGLDGVSDTMAAAVWALDYVLSGAALGVNGFNFQLGGKGHNNSSLALGDERIVEVRPEHYALTMLADMGAAQMLKTRIESAPQRVAAHAMLDAAGRISVVLVNMAANNAVTASVNAGKITTASTLLLTGGGLTSTKATLGGATMEHNGAVNPAWQLATASTDGTFSIQLPPASAVWLKTQA